MNAQLELSAEEGRRDLEKEKVSDFDGPLLDTRVFQLAERLQQGVLLRAALPRIAISGVTAENRSFVRAPKLQVKV